MRRFRTTTFFVEGRARPDRRRRIDGAPRSVALAVGLPVIVLWFALANTGLAVMPILQGLVVWLALSLYACYVLSDDLFGSVDSVTVDTAAVEGPAPATRFRTRLPFGRALLGVDFAEDRPLTRSAVGLGSNVELVGRLLEFYRANSDRRAALVDLDRALETFEMHH